MRSSSLTGIVALGAVAALSTAGLSGPVVFAQARTSPPASKLAAQWKLNRDLSADIRDVAVSAPAPGGPVSAPPSGSYPTGGVSRIGGGYGGGGFGGSGVTSERTLRDRAILREASQMPAVLNIVVSGTAVTMTTEDGTTRKFNATGKKEKVDLTTAEVDTTTHWDQGTLVQEMSSGDLKLKRSWQATEQGNQLVITVTTERSKRTAPVTVKLVYDKSAG